MRDILLVALSLVVCAMAAPSLGDIVPAGVDDKATLGDWLGVYGSEGYILCSYDGVGVDRASLPGYVSGYGLTDVSMWVWNDPSAYPQGLQDPADPGHRVEACWYRPDPYLWSVTLTPAETRQFKLALYFLDPENNRTATITFAGAGLTGTDTIWQTYPGTWRVYDVSATAGQDITITFDQIGGPNAVLSAMAFDPIPEPATVALLVCGAAGLIRRRK